jgi:hypothetical protein
MLRPVYKNIFRNIEWLLPFWALLRDENSFSLIRSNVVSKNPSFHTDLKNVHMTFVKSTPKKSFDQNTDFLGKNW